MKTQECKKCGGNCKPSEALLNTLVSASDFGNDAGSRGTTVSRIGQAKLVDCLKCEDCGHSFIPNNLVTSSEQLQLIIDDVFKPKQPKEFNPELFKAYINKFSEADRMKMLLEVFDSLNPSSKIFSKAMIDDVLKESN